MPFSVVMPALEMAQETGKLISWRKKEGDHVSKGEPLLEIETDKAVVEVESPADGVLAGITASEGTEIPVGQTIAWIVAPGERPPIDAALAPASPTARTASHAKTGTSQAESVTVPTSADATSTSGAKISPKARRLAKELGVAISALRGSGPSGEILASDVQAATVGTAPIGSSGGPEVSGLSAVQPASEIPSVKLEVPTSIGRIMAERTTQSWTTVPHFFVSRDLEATALNDYRSRIALDIERTRSLRITHTDLLVSLVAQVLLRHPRLNASWTPDGIRLHDYVHMGVAIAVNDGVVAGVIPNAHAASLVDIAQRRFDLTNRAKAGKLAPSEIAGATFTISNLGMYKVDQFSGIITPPQAAILAVGAIADRVVARAGNAVVRPMMTLTISCDHRVADGSRAARFLDDLADALGQPATLLS